jgi:hypothetical protein
MLVNQFYYKKKKKKKDNTCNLNNNIYFSVFIGFYRANVSKTYLLFKCRLPFEPHNIYPAQPPVQILERLLFISEVPGFGNPGCGLLQFSSLLPGKQ